MRRGCLLSILCVLAMAATASAGESRTAADVTEPGRSLARAIDMALSPVAGAEGDPRTVLFLVDPTTSLRNAGFADLFDQSLSRRAEELAASGAFLGIAAIGDSGKPLLVPAAEAARVAARLREILATPKQAIQNVYADVRTVLGAFSKGRGDRRLVLVTLDNGDAEDDVEKTVAALRRAHVSFWAVTGEAFLSDSYWVNGSRARPPRLSLGAGDGAFVQLPWGWLFQMQVANEVAPSGFAQYGLSRLAAGSEGRVFLYAAPTSGHRCAVYGSCNFCSNDHAPGGETFRAARLRPLAPLAEARARAYGAGARDSAYRALLKAWRTASKEGLIRSRPSVRAGAGGLKPERRQQGNWLSLATSSTAFTSLANRGEKAARVCEQIARALEADLGDGRDGGAPTRQRAMAEFSLVMLHLTHTNLLGFTAFCREVAPAYVGKAPFELVPPEVHPISTDQRVVGVSYSNLCLCHGVRPFFDVHFPGGEPFRTALRALDERAAAFLRRYAHTPYAAALRSAGLARFHLTFRGKVIPPPERDRAGSRTEQETTDPERPNRSPGTGSGSSGGPVTGG